MKILGFTNTNGSEIGIPVNKITGFIAQSNPNYGNCFIATGADGADGGENGWYVQETYKEVWMMVEACELT